MINNSTSSFLTDLCGKNLLTEKKFIVPSYSIGHQVGEAVTKAGQAWINLRFVTIPSLAMEITGIELSSQGLKNISSTSARVLINHIFRELKENKELIYYGQLEAQAGIIDAIHRSIRDLRSAGIRSADLKTGQFIDKQKGRETQHILSRYEEELVKRRLFDTAELLTAAAEICRKNPPKPGPLYLCLENQIFSRLERDFLDALTKDLILVPQGIVKEMPRPRRLLPVPEPKREAPKPSSNLERAPWLFALKDAPQPFEDDTIQLFQAVGPTNECREVCRRILQSKVPFDQVEVIHPPDSLYPSIFHGLSKKTGLKFTSAEGLPLGFTTPGKVYSFIIRWIEDEYPSADFCAVLESESLKTPKAQKDASVSPTRISRIIKDAKIGWGKTRYVSRLKTLSEEMRKKYESEGRPNDSVKQIHTVTAWIKAMLELFPSWEDDEYIETADLCTGISSFLKKYCRVRDDTDGEALGKITSRLDEASSHKSLRLPKDNALEWLSSLAEPIRVGASGPKPGHVHLAAFHAGGHAASAHTFIVGLDQDAIPGSRLPDPILLDEEREAISADLAVTSDRLRENLYSMTALLSSLRGSTTLSFSSYDVIEDRPSFPSSFVLQVFRLLKGDAALDYTALASALGNPSGFIPSLPTKLDATDWWLDLIASDEQFKDALASIKKNFPHVAQGDYARKMRAGPDLTTYDGIIAPADESFHPCLNPDLAMSASRIERLAKCPYSYFLRYILNIQSPEEVILDKAQWLDGLQYGTLFHDILCAFMRGLRHKGEPVRGEKNRAEIRAAAEEILSRHREENPPPSEVIFSREKEHIFSNLDVFLQAECRREQKVQPLFFEVNFGFTGDEGEGIPESVVVEIEPGKAFRLHGRIDRIDRLSENHFRVIDYKTGSYSPFEAVKEFGKGRYLQHALYALAAEKILEGKGVARTPRVTTSGYSFPTARGDGREILFERIDRARLAELLSDLFVFLEKGLFIVNPRDKRKCDYCDYKVLCGRGVLERAEEKRETNEAEYALFDKLEIYE